VTQGRHARTTAIDWTDVKRRLAKMTPAHELMSAERSAQILEQRAKQLARVSDADSARSNEIEFVTFTLATERYALEAAYVIGVIKLIELTRLPGAPAHLLGVTHLRGDILPVFDLRILLGVARGGLHDMSRLLVLGRRDAEIGILADSIEEMTWFDPATALAPTTSIAGVGRQYLRGITRNALIVLDGRELLDDPNLFVEDAARPVDGDR